MRRHLVFVAVAALVLIPACGGGGDGGPGGNTPNNFSRGPFVFAMPFLPTVQGESLVLGLTNLAAQPAPVEITALTPFGTSYPGGTDRIVLPARGSARYPISNFTGIGTTLGGWLEVETREIDPVTGLATDLTTSGLVVPVMTRSIATLEQDAAGGIAFRSDRAEVTLTEDTISAQLINASKDGGVGVEVGFDVVVYDAYGAIESVTTASVPGRGSVQLDFGAQQTGQVQVRPIQGVGQVAPPGTEYHFGIATLEADPQVLIEARYLERRDANAGQFDVGFDLEWGLDEDGNTHDFGVFLSNPTNQAATVQLSAVHTMTGASLLPTPRVIALDAHATKFVASSTLRSRGLDQLEDSVFEDIFGDVQFATALTVFTARFSTPREVNISARDYDSLFKQYYRIIPGYRQTTDVVIPAMDVEITDAGGIRNWATLMNPFNGSQTVNVRGFTPGGTEYILEPPHSPIVVGPFGRVNWSPDGLIFREDPTDINAPPVPFMTFLFSSSGGLFFDGRRTRVDIDGIIRFQRPFFVRNLRTD